MATLTEAQKRIVRDYWGHHCIICGAPPREPSPAESWMGIEEVCIPIHHADGDQSNNVLQNIVPLCDRDDAEADACHQKIHSGTGDPVHHVFSRFLLGKVSRDAIELVATWFSDQCRPLSREEKRRVAQVIVEYGQQLTAEAVQQLPRQVSD